MTEYDKNAVSPVNEREISLPDCMNIDNFQLSDSEGTTESLSIKPPFFQTGNYTIGSPGSQVFKLKLELHINSSGCSTC